MDEFIIIKGGFSYDFVNIPSSIPLKSLTFFYCAYLYNNHSCFESVKYSIYADDMKIYMRVQSAQGCKLIQQDLNGLYQFYSQNNKTINVFKG